MDIESLKAEEEELRKEIAALNQDEKKHYYQLEKQRVKDPDNYAVLNYFFAAGLHHFYLGKYARGAINAIIMLIGIIFIESFGLWLIIAVCLIELPQLFMSQRIVYQYNNNVMRDTLSEVRSTHS